MAERPATRARSNARGLVAVGHAGSVLLIDGATGEVIWERSLAEIEGASACDNQPVTVRLARARVIAGAMGHVFALALRDGSVLWHVDRRRRGDGATNLAIERD